MYVAVDIETCRNDEAEGYFLSGLVKPDRRLKDKEKIKESLDKQYSQCGLSWWLGKVCGISASTIDHSSTFNGFTTDEKTLLTEFAEYLYAIDQQEIYLVGKNSKSFDFPFLVGRYMRHDLGVPKWLMKKYPINDVDEIFAHYSRNEQTTSLANYAWGLNIPGKMDGMDGSMVQGLYDAGDFEKIQKYCVKDREIVAEILKRYRAYDGGRNVPI